MEYIMMYLMSLCSHTCKCSFLFPISSFSLASCFFYMLEEYLLYPILIESTVGFLTFSIFLKLGVLLTLYKYNWFLHNLFTTAFCFVNWNIFTQGRTFVHISLTSASWFRVLYLYQCLIITLHYWRRNEMNNWIHP